MNRRYVIARNKQANWFTDLFKSNDTKMLQELEKKLRQNGQRADKKNMDCYTKNGQKYVRNGNDIYIVGQKGTFVTKQKTYFETFITNFLKSQSIGINYSDLTTIDNAFESYLNNLKSIEIDSQYSLYQVQ